MINDINTYDDFSPSNPVNQKEVRSFADVDLEIQEHLSSSDFDIYEEELASRSRKVKNLQLKLNYAQTVQNKMKAYLEKEAHPFPKNSDDIFELSEMNKELKNLLNIK